MVVFYCAFAEKLRIHRQFRGQKQNKECCEIRREIPPIFKGEIAQIAAAKAAAFFAEDEDKIRHRNARAKQKRHGRRQQKTPSEHANKCGRQEHRRKRERECAEECPRPDFAVYKEPRDKMNNQPDYEKFESARKKQSAKIGQKRQSRFGEKRAPPRPVRNVGNSPFQIRRKQNLRRAQKYGKRRKKRLKQNYERNGAFETPHGQVKPSKTTEIHMSEFLATTAQKSTKKPYFRRN